VNCATLSEPFQGNVLGEGNVGIIVLDVFAGGCSLDETVQHFSKIPHPMDRDVYLGKKRRHPIYLSTGSGMQKRSQLSIHRRQATQTLRLCQQQHAVTWNVAINLSQKKLFN
jgi:hypothetical protein